MLCKTVYLRDDDKDVCLDTFVCPPLFGCDAEGGRDTVIVLPGGAYNGFASHEGEPVARAFVAQGFNAFVLYYSVGEKAVFPRPLQDVSMALAHIKRNAEEYHVNPDRIFLCGFSAGGHLAASAGTMWHRDFAAFEGMETGENRPCGTILSYPVTTLGEHTHLFCKYRILGNWSAAVEDGEEYSPERNVTENTPPAFIWHTAEDKDVNVKNALMMASALIEKGIPVELHIYPFGSHGFSLATKLTDCNYPEHTDPHVASWFNDCIEWTKII